MFGFTPFETIQVIAWIITGTAAIITPIVAVRWLTADFRDFKTTIKSELLTVREELDGFSDEIKADIKAHVSGLHNRIDRHESKYDSEILRVDSRISETRERLAAVASRQ